MKKDQIIDLQEEIGTTPDGIWGPKSRSSLRSYLRSKSPEPNPWPHSNQAALRSFYGDPWDNKPIVGIDAPSWLRLYGGDQPIQLIWCHEKVADSLLKALDKAYAIAPDVVKSYYGCHVDRAMRGGSSPSLHAYGAAIDLDANTNRNRQLWPVSATMPLSVMVAFAEEGWTPAGAVWGRDAMHFQATRWE